MRTGGAFTRKGEQLEAQLMASAPKAHRFARSPFGGLRGPTKTSLA